MADRLRRLDKCLNAMPHDVFELFVAARYLRARRKEAVISIITLISVAGVAAGVMALVMALAINNGFREHAAARAAQRYSPHQRRRKKTVPASRNGPRWFPACSASRM